MHNKTIFDSENNYCRMLGHDVAFSYCKIAKNDIPCFKIIDCWFEKLPIQDYLKSNYSEKEIEKILEKPANKITTLYDLIQQAKNRQAKDK